MTLVSTLAALALCSGVDARIATYARSLGAPVSHACSDLPTASEAALCRQGEVLFHARSLSADGAASCASCHDPARAFRDGRARPRLRGHALRTARTPTLLDVGRVAGPFFWNGRAPTLEGQIFWPLYAPAEIGATTGTLAAHGGAGAVAASLAAYLRTLNTSPAPFDAYAHGDCSALAPAEVRGMRSVLTEKNCTRCHGGPEARGTRPELLRYVRLPAHAFLGAESSYSADVQLAESPRGGRATLGSVPQSLRNLVHRGPPWGRYGSHATLGAFLVDHGTQPEDTALRDAYSQAELADVLAFLFVGLRSRAGAHPGVPPLP